MKMAGNFLLKSSLAFQSGNQMEAGSWKWQQMVVGRCGWCSDHSTQLYQLGRGLLTLTLKPNGKGNERAESSYRFDIKFPSAL